ncbi:mechanosensitive ion channel family protein [Aquibacillus koreensis]|uniref:Mechanosensitive ion channel family protein n=1 Tax=Aquibacillus koreensis TaxID=279446 RepID=A0A9X3WN72_9BACI|nr:mechanosensitive ion channel family protein [Aquibacillus koreensis]MCT2536416.1 mechanosensitive ion channel family protein [Aquibacillus koreensis]MDC3422765.1 mechanosensitive ion channel family protein [Aquibacillus koreensis]
MEFIEEEFNAIWDRISGPELWIDISIVFFRIVLIILLASLIVKVGTKLISRIFRKRDKGPFRITERRENTLKKLVQNTLSYVVYFTAFLMVLDTLTIPIGALLAGAGVAGLAIGFGTQNLVRDIITGFFIIFEDQFSVGDYVRTSGVEGIVEEIGLRTTKVMSWTGELHIIPNGNVTQVTNFSIHNSIAVVDLNVPYESDIAKVEKIIGELLLELPEQYEQLKAVPEMLGVQMLETSHVVLRVIAEVNPMEHWAMARILRKEIKGRLEERGIDIPLPRLVMYSREDGNIDN